jgi:hypothetical protein
MKDIRKQLVERLEKLNKAQTAVDQLKSEIVALTLKLAREAASDDESTEFSSLVHFAGDAW